MENGWVCCPSPKGWKGNRMCSGGARNLKGESAPTSHLPSVDFICSCFSRKLWRRGIVNGCQLGWRLLVMEKKKNDGPVLQSLSIKEAGVRGLTRPGLKWAARQHQLVWSEWTNRKERRSGQKEKTNAGIELKRLSWHAGPPDDLDSLHVKRILVVGCSYLDIKDNTHVSMFRLIQL
jgi:hypothetical protein